MSKTITRVIPRTRVTAEFVNPVTKEFYETEYEFLGGYVKRDKAKQLITNTLIGENHPVLVGLKKVVHESVRYTMPVQAFCNNATPEVLSATEQSE